MGPSNSVLLNLHMGAHWIEYSLVGTKIRFDECVYRWKKYSDVSMNINFNYVYIF